MKDVLATDEIVVSTCNHLPPKQAADPPLRQGKLRRCGTQMVSAWLSEVRLHLVGCVEDVGLISVDNLKPIIDAIVSSLLRHLLLTAAMLPGDVVLE